MWQRASNWQFEGDINKRGLRFDTLPWIELRKAATRCRFCRLIVASVRELYDATQNEQTFSVVIHFGEDYTSSMLGEPMASVCHLVVHL